MARIAAAILPLLLVQLSSPVRAQQPSQARYIVVFDDVTPFDRVGFVEGTLDARAQTSPEAWNYLDRFVLGAVRALESDYGIRAEQVYSAAIRGFSARLTIEQVVMLQRLSFVVSIEPDSLMSSLETLDGVARQQLDAFLDVDRSARGIDASRQRLYVIDARLERIRRVPGIVGFVKLSADSWCVPGGHSNEAALAGGGRAPIPGAAAGSAVVGVDASDCSGVAWASSALKGVDWISAKAGESAIVSMRLGGSTNPSLDAAIRRSADRNVDYVIAGGAPLDNPCATSPESAGTHDRVVVAATMTPGSEPSGQIREGCVDLWLRSAGDEMAADAASTSQRIDTAAASQPSVSGPEPAADGWSADASVPAESTPGGGAFNVKVVSDASPDLTDLSSLIGSTTSRWTADREKVWALFYWSHILKRQTSPMVLHGFEVTDPIRNFTDYGFTMCSTMSGINQTLYEALGLPHEYWDVCNHTVSSVFYDGQFHMVDSAFSNLVTNDDGVTLATVTDVAADAARLLRERSLYATSPNGFLTGSDTIRNLSNFVGPDGSTLSGLATAFCATNLKRRDYYYNWNAGHRYVLNLREDESYTRYYRRLGSSADYWVGSERVSAPDPADTFEIDAANRFNLRGNGRWTFSPKLTPEAFAQAAYRSGNVTALASGGLKPQAAGQTSEIVYKVQAGNAIASQKIQAAFSRTDPSAAATIALSVNHGATWTEIGGVGSIVGTSVPVAINLRNELNGAYETLIRIQMRTNPSAPDGVILTGLTIETLTQVNTKALPKLHLGRNEMFVGLGAQSDTMVLWPDLRGNLWQKDAYASANIASQTVSVPRKYTGAVYPAVLTSDAHLTYRMEAPTAITRVVYGGRLYNRTAGSYIDFLHSFDGGASWIRSFRFTDASLPYDDIHYVTVTDIPAGVRTMLFKFLIHNTNADPARATGLYSVRMEVNHTPMTAAPRPLELTLRWNEVAPDRTTRARSHKQRISSFPFKYVVNVGGSDHPIMESLTVNLENAGDSTPFGYNDGVDAGGQKYVHRKRVDGANHAKGRPYTFSRTPSGFQASAGATNTTILTDGIVGAPATGGVSYWWGQCWTAGQTVDLRVDLGQTQMVGAIRAHLFGYPFWDAMKGEVQDRIEILTSLDGVTFSSHGLLATSLWKKEVPINHMLQDDERATGWNFERLLSGQVAARFVMYRMTPARNLCASELQVLDRVDYQPFDIRIALPSTSATVLVPSVVGLTQSAAASAIAGASLVLGTVTMTTSNTVPAGSVVTQNPAAGTSVSPGSAVSLVVSSGPPTTLVPVPNVVGSTQAAATSALGAAGLTVGTVTTSTSTTVPAGRVISQHPAAGVGVAPGTPVALIVSSGAPADPQPGDEIVLYAAERAQVLGGWGVVPDTTAAGGARLQNANVNAPKRSTALASPTDAFDLTFTAVAGKPYRIWIRGKAENNYWGNDSIFVQFDGSVDAAGAPIWRIGTTSAVPIVLEDPSVGLQGWGWADTGYANEPAPLVYFAQSGPQRIRIQIREDGVGIDQVVLSAVRYLTTAPGAPSNDATILPRTPDPGPDPGSPEEVVLYAAAQAQVLGGWTVVADTTAAAGARLQNANMNAPKITTPLAAPPHAFDLTFTAVAGKPYRIWIRGRAENDHWGNDSIFVQFDGSLDAAGAPIWRIGTASAVPIVLEDPTVGLQGWGWADTGYGSEPTPLVYFAQSGPQRIRIQIREDGVGIDQVLLSAVRYLTTAPGAPRNDATIVPQTPSSQEPATGDEVVLYAAEQAQVLGGWTLVPDPSAAGGARLQNANVNAPKITAPLAAPAHAFDLTFTAVSGKPYRIWIRGKAENNSWSNDSVFVQFDGSVNASGAAIWRIGTTSAVPIVLEDPTVGLQGWGWADTGYGSEPTPLVYFAQSGPQRIRIQIREDGVGIDQVVLSAATYLATAPGATRNDTTIVPR